MNTFTYPEFNPVERQQLEEAAVVFNSMADKYEQQLNGTRADDIQAGGSH